MKIFRLWKVTYWDKDSHVVGGYTYRTRTDEPYRVVESILSVDSFTHKSKPVTLMQWIRGEW